ncbi:GH3 family domain-containing protein [Neoroseomonas oryzicola]|uniref:GH3 auxin-responsive promoter family protein n=1 Tax=Neoroseomonas oryzicola TaxID=535904 RepID=A0A9X9WJZ2_9PROT|nr:GH3 auxin-responsive promoter family protein [Neoroseomonas oryzicola]NKE19990.1 GH3 auxin-responsive promoter family protein [Neoroseomonas oryzicola]
MSLAARSANAIWRLASISADVRLRRALPACCEVQSGLLEKLLAANVRTVFGHKHDFARIRTPRDFRSAVPVNTYSDLAPLIDRIAVGEPRVLTAAPVTHFALTAGTGGPAKLVPYTAPLQAQFRAALAPWMAEVFRTVQGAGDGPAYWAISPALGRSRTAGGIPVGFDEDSAYLGGLMKPVIDAALAVPGSVSRIEDVEIHRQATALCLLAREDLALVSIWHPSFLPLLWRWMLGHWDTLLALLAGGMSLTGTGLHLAPRPARARALAGLRDPSPASVWPRLRLISAWGHGFAAAYLPELARLFPQAMIQPKGVIATEGFVTLPHAGRQILAVTAHVFEFETPSGDVLWPWELEPGQEYAPLVTTAGGLYRYRIPDRLRCTGRLGTTPCLEFLGRQGMRSDRFGEKLEEDFVAGVIGTLFHGTTLAFALLAPEETAAGIAYTLYIEGARSDPCLADRLDQALSANVHYAHCRRLGQLAPARIATTGPAAQDRYTARMTAERGQRLGDVKPLALSPMTGWDAALARKGCDA